jgi:hypothetical protein
VIYRAEVNEIHAAHRARVADIHRQYHNVGTMAAQDVPPLSHQVKVAEKARAFALIRAAQKRNAALVPVPGSGTNGEDQ